MVAQNRLEGSPHTSLQWCWNWSFSLAACKQFISVWVSSLASFTIARVKTVNRLVKWISKPWANKVFHFFDWWPFVWLTTLQKLRRWQGLIYNFRLYSCSDWWNFITGMKCFCLMQLIFLHKQKRTQWIYERTIPKSNKYIQNLFWCVVSLKGL